MIIKNSKYLSIEKIQHEIAKIIGSYSGYKAYMWNHFELKGLYRARQHNHLLGTINENILSPFNSELEFWNAPEKSCKLGRCNGVNESVFYCSNEFEVAIQEIKPASKYITVASFKPKPKHLQSSFSTAIPIGIQYLKELPALKKNFQNIGFDESKFKELDDFLNNLFYSDISDNKLYLYKLTTAITRNMMIPIRRGTRDIPMQGIVYSSMARDKKGFNMAYKPNHIISNYYLSTVQTLEVKENSTDTITLQLKRHGYPLNVRNSIDQSFNIHWCEPIINGEVYTFHK